jgi:hypothetical protein
VNNRYCITYRTESGLKEKRITPFVKHSGEAILWLYRQKPSILKHFEDVEVRPYHAGDGR